MGWAADCNVPVKVVAEDAPTEVTPAKVVTLGWAAVINVPVILFAWKSAFSIIVNAPGVEVSLEVNAETNRLLLSFHNKQVKDLLYKFTLSLADGELLNAVDKVATFVVPLYATIFLTRLFKVPDVILIHQLL